MFNSYFEFTYVCMRNLCVYVFVPINAYESNFISAQYWEQTFPVSQHNMIEVPPPKRLIGIASRKCLYFISYIKVILFFKYFKISTFHFIYTEGE